MTDASWRQELRRQQRACEQTLRAILSQQRGIPVRLRQAMAHSLFGGGKRLRPLLTVWCTDALTGAGRGGAGAHRVALRTGAALEMIHTYSLIHDDLPAMDDDILRRGRPTCHVAFGEATAILAGDALHAVAFEVLAGCGERAAELVRLIAAAVGPAGMVGGQHDDLDAEGKPVTAAQVRRIHGRKTAALIAACLAAGGLIAGASRSRVARLHDAGQWLGLAFQGADDLLDVTATSAELGKSAGKDAAAGKATYIRVAGLEAARARTERDGQRGVALLRETLPEGPRSERLLILAASMWRRQR